MTGRARCARACAVAGAAAAGVLVAHRLDYLVVVPHEAARGAVLEGTGHGWFGGAVAPVAAAAIVAGLVALASGFASARRGRGNASLRSTALRLSATQALLFAAIEVAERATAGAPHDDPFGSIFVLGLALQPPVATAGALLLLVLERVGERAALVPAPAEGSPLRRARIAPAPPVLRPPAPATAGAGRIRSPPSPLAHCA